MREWEKPLEIKVFLSHFFFIKNRGMGEKWEKNTIMVGDGLRIQLILGQDQVPQHYSNLHKFIVIFKQIINWEIKLGKT